MAYKMKNPYPKMGTVTTSRKGEINKDFEANSNLKDGRSKSSTFQRYKKTGSTMDSYESMKKIG